MAPTCPANTATAPVRPGCTRSCRVPWGWAAHCRGGSSGRGGRWRCRRGWRCPAYSRSRACTTAGGPRRRPPPPPTPLPLGRRPQAGRGRGAALSSRRTGRRRWRWGRGCRSGRGSRGRVGRGRPTPAPRRCTPGPARRARGSGCPSRGRCSRGGRVGSRSALRSGCSCRAGTGWHRSWRRRGSSTWRHTPRPARARSNSRWGTDPYRAARPTPPGTGTRRGRGGGSAAVAATHCRRWCWRESGALMRASASRQAWSPASQYAGSLASDDSRRRAPGPVTRSATPASWLATVSRTS